MPRNTVFLFGMAWSLLLLAWSAAGQATISSVTPQFGPRKGGTLVTLEGTGLDAGPIAIGGVAVTDLQVTSGALVSFTTGDANPTKAYGKQLITVNGENTTTYFYYLDAGIVEDLVDATRTVSIGDYIKADIKSATTKEVWIEEAPPAGVTLKQHSGTTISSFPAQVTDSAGRIQIVFPSAAGKVAGAVKFRVVADSVEAEQNALDLYASAAACTLVNMQPPLGVDFVSPPAPSVVDIRWDQVASRFKFDVVMDYLRHKTVVMIDFAGDYSPNTHGVRNVHATTKCHSRAATIAAPSTWPFYELFASAPTATFPQSLAGSYGAFPPTTSLWTVASEATSCNTIRYAGTFTFAQLVGCDKMDGAPAVTVTAENDKITYSGALQVVVAQPINSEKEAEGFYTTYFRYPFLLTFNSLVEATSEFTSTDNLKVRVLSVDVAANEPRTLSIVIRTTSTVSSTDSSLTAVDPADALEGGLAVFGAAVANPACANDDLINCVQTWTYETAAEWNPLADNGEYRFKWSFGAEATLVTATFDIQQTLTETTNTTGLEIAGVTLGFYSTQADMLAESNPRSDPYGNEDTVFVRTTLDVNGGDPNNFDLEINDMWVCWENNPLFEIALPDGCRSDLIPTDQVLHLIAAGLPETFINPEARFQTQIVPITGNAIGASFISQPLATEELDGQEFTVHMRVTIIQEDLNTRSEHSLVIPSSQLVGRANDKRAPSGAGIGSFGVLVGSDEKGGSSGGGGDIVPVVAGVAVPAVVLLIAVGTCSVGGFILYRKRRGFTSRMRSLTNSMSSEADV